MYHTARLISICLLFLVSCKATESGDKEREHVVIPEGTVVASDSMKIPDDLNVLYYSVQVVAGEQAGVYEVIAKYGYNEATGTFTMPRGGEELVPVMKRSEQPLSYIVGFYRPGEKDFHDYFLIKAGRNRIEMKYLKAYEFR